MKAFLSFLCVCANVHYTLDCLLLTPSFPHSSLVQRKPQQTFFRNQEKREIQKGLRIFVWYSFIIQVGLSKAMQLMSVRNNAHLISFLNMGFVFLLFDVFSFLPNIHVSLFMFSVSRYILYLKILKYQNCN